MNSEPINQQRAESGCVDRVVRPLKFMKDNRTREEKYSAWVECVNITHKKGWTHMSSDRGWVFKSPRGIAIDLSASDLTKLDEIEQSQIEAVLAAREQRKAI
jgi:hypothetical protein